MKEAFVKKYWGEEDILYYLYFIGNDVVRQIEISNDAKVFLHVDNPDDAKLIYDQNLDELELNEEDFIAKAEFEEAWTLKTQ